MKKKANKLFDDNDENKSGKLNKSQYEGITEEGLTFPKYDEQTYKETYPDGINKKQFVQLYKTAITEAKAEAKANKIFDDNNESGKLNQDKYKNIKDKLVKEEGLKLPEYDEEAYPDGINKEQFAKLYKDAAANSSMLSRISSKASSKGSNVTRKMRNSGKNFGNSTKGFINKNVLGQIPIEELKGETAAKKIFKTETEQAKIDKINKEIYKKIKEYLSNDKLNLTLPNYEEIRDEEKDKDGINENQFVNIYKEAKAKANSTKTGEEAKKAEIPAIKAEIPPIEAETNEILKEVGIGLDKDKLNPAEYKKIKHYVIKKGLKLQDYNKIPKEKKDEDGIISKETFLNLYKDAKDAKAKAKATAEAKTNKITDTKATANLNKKTKKQKISSSIRMELYKILDALYLVGSQEQYKNIKLDQAKYKKIKHKLRDNTNITIKQLTRIPDDNKGLKLQDYNKIPKEKKDEDGKINKNLLEKLYVDAKDAKAKEKAKAKAGGAKKNRTRKLKGNKKGKGKRTK